MPLVAPYCAIPRDYLSDTPLLRAMGFLVSQHGQLGAIPPPFSERFPHEEHAKWRCDTPPQKGYLSDTGAIPYENKANGCDTPVCDTISKGYCAIWGGISHWAAKPCLTSHNIRNHCIRKFWGVIFCKDFMMSITSKYSRGIHIVILAFRMVIDYIEKSQACFLYTSLKLSLLGKWETPTSLKSCSELDSIAKIERLEASKGPHALKP